MSEAINRAVEAARRARPRPLAPSAVTLLAAYEPFLAHFGGLAGELDIVDAAATLTWALKSIDALLIIARAS